MNGFEERVYIDRAPTDVWRVLADLAGVADWAPFVTRSRLTTNGDLGVGSRRVLRHHLGFTLHEAVTEWTEGTGFSYTVFGAPYPLEAFRETWRVEPTATGTTVTTRMTYRLRLGPLSALADRILVRHLIRRALRLGHRGLKRHLESSFDAAGADVAAGDGAG